MINCNKKKAPLRDKGCDDSAAIKTITLSSLRAVKDVRGQVSSGRQTL